MDLWTACVASLPPSFAILVEFINPITERLVESKVKEDLTDFEPGENHHHLIDTTKMMLMGAVEVAGLAPTFIAAMTAGIGVVGEFVKAWTSSKYAVSDFFIAGGFFLILVFLLLVVLNFLGGQTFLQIEATRPASWLFGKKPRWTGSQIIRGLIVLVNALLMLLIWSAYFSLRASTPHGH